MKNTISGSILEQDDCNVIPFLDTSEYLPNVTNPVLKITPPNWTSYVNVEYNMNAITLLKASHLKQCDLPSGIYQICQSVCPNKETETCFCFLNTCKETKRLNDLACAVLEEDCSEDRERKLKEIFCLKFQLETAKGIADTDSSKAIELFNISCKQISKLESKTDLSNCNC